MDRWLIPCACGCGASIVNFGRDGQPIRYKVGHNWTPALSKLGATASVASPNAKQSRSNAGKKSWSDPAYRQRMAESVQRQWADPAFKDKTLSAARKGIRLKWEDPGFRAKMSESGKRQIAILRKNPDAMRRNREIQSKRLRALWKTPEWIIKISKAHAHQCGTLRTSRPEKRLRAFLKDGGVGFITNKRFVLKDGYTVPDVFVESLSLAVFTDGTYWHGKPKKKQRDMEQRSALQQMGIAVFVIDQGQPEAPQFESLLRKIGELS